jgi:hypothetical protein
MLDRQRCPLGDVDIAQVVVPHSLGLAVLGEEEKIGFVTPARRSRRHLEGGLERTTGRIRPGASA